MFKDYWKVFEQRERNLHKYIKRIKLFHIFMNLKKNWEIKYGPINKATNLQLLSDWEGSAWNYYLIVMITLLRVPTKTQKCNYKCVCIHKILSDLNNTTRTEDQSQKLEGLNVYMIMFLRTLQSTHKTKTPEIALLSDLLPCYFIIFFSWIITKKGLPHLPWYRFHTSFALNSAIFLCLRGMHLY